MIPLGRPALFALLALGCLAARAQVIEFESGGLRYQTLTKNGVTIMFAHLPSHIRDYSIMQVAVSNGSPGTWTIRPEDMSFQSKEGSPIRATPADVVITKLISHAGRNDVIKLTSAYEMGLYGMTRFRSTSGYEQRRQAALAEVSSARIKAAAAASAIAFVETKLAPGQSTDGAVFFAVQGKAGPGRLVVKVANSLFEFDTSFAAQ